MRRKPTAYSRRASRPTHWRFTCVTVFVALMGVCLLARLVYVNVIDHYFLLRQGNQRIIRYLPLPAKRGRILSSDGSPLAMSAPVDAVWINPQRFKASPAQMRLLVSLLNVDAKALHQRMTAHKKKQFYYLKHNLPPSVTALIADLDIPGVHFEHDQRRFYPEGSVTAHVLGLTDAHNHGQEGLELVYDHLLSGQPGRRKVEVDRDGHVIKVLRVLRSAQPGQSIQLTINRKIQFIAYRSIKAAVTQYKAESGSIVVMNPKTGAILAMANYPSYNPNRREADTQGRYRNRAVTDMFEPGSVIKPFNIALALESGKYTPDSTVDTSPGRLRVGKYVIKDDGLNYGVLSLTEVLQKSSNIGAAKIMLTLDPESYSQLLARVGFGVRTNSGFPGESPGVLVDHSVWRNSTIAALAYGYGIDATLLQLVHAYGVLANHGGDAPVHFMLASATNVSAEQLVPRDIADTVVRMLVSVVEKGTWRGGSVKGYTVAGKTGTSYIATRGGYDKHRYIGTFIGMAPAEDPQLVIGVMVRDPKGQHFGGIVAGPVFSSVMSGALRILNIPPVQVQTSVDSATDK